MFEGSAYLAVEIVCLIGCIWAHMPWKKMLMVQLLAPAVVFGSFLMIAAATTFLVVILVFILGLVGIDIERYFGTIALVIAGMIVSTITWLYFSNEREINLREAGQKNSTQPAHEP